MTPRLPTMPRLIASTMLPVVVSVLLWLLTASAVQVQEEDNSSSVWLDFLNRRISIGE